MQGAERTAKYHGGPQEAAPGTGDFCVHGRESLLS